MEEVRYMISEASRRVEVESHVLRYWEEELEIPIERNELGHRYYKESDIGLLRKVKELKNRGFQLKAIKMLIPNIHKMDSLDEMTTDRLKDKLNGKVLEMIRDEDNESDGETKGTSLTVKNKKHEIEQVKVNTDKMKQFKGLMNEIIMDALKQNNELLTDDISNNVTESVTREMNYLMRLQEEKDEERYRKFDATIREYQRSRMMVAATKGQKRKKSKFFKKHDVYI